MGFDGMELIAEIRQIYDNYGFDTEIPVSYTHLDVYKRQVPAPGSFSE